MEYSMRLVVIIMLLMIALVVFIALLTTQGGIAVDLIKGLQQFLEGLFSR